MGELYLKRKIDLFLSEWKKNPERKLQTETHTVIGKAARDFQNQQKIQKNDREQRLAGIYYNRGRNAGCKPEH